MYIHALFLVLTFLTVAKAGDPIVSGSSVGVCTVAIIAEEPFQALPLEESGSAVPATCTDFSGVWEGGCFWGAVKPAVVTLNGVGVYAEDTTLAENVYTKADTEGKPTLGRVHTVKITQKGCSEVAFEDAPQGAPMKDTFLDITKVARYEAKKQFLRDCIAGNTSWKRTYEMSLSGRLSSQWKSDNSLTTVTTLKGEDKNYGASYTAVERARYSLVSANRLQAQYAVYQKRDNYDPPAFSWDPAAVGGRVCVYKKLP